MDYIEQMVLTASPAKLIELLLQKAISVIDEAKNYIDEKIITMRTQKLLGLKI